MATLEQIQGKVKKLQAQAEALIAKQADAALAAIRKLMDEHGLTSADIDAHSASKKRAGRPAGEGAARAATRKTATKATKATKTPKVTKATKSTASEPAKGKLPPKYRDPKTGATWSGHARPPAWIASARDRTKFLIDAGAAVGANAVSKAKAALKKTSATVGAVARAGKSKGPLPAKYRDPQSGATWSGRGPAPAWLAAAKDRTKFLIDGAATAASNGAATTKAAVKKTGAAKKAASAKKSPAKKAARKATVTSAKSAAATKTSKPAVKKVAKSSVASGKNVATKKAPTKSDANDAPAASAPASEAVSTQAPM